MDASAMCGQILMESGFLSLIMYISLLGLGKIYILIKHEEYIIVCTWRTALPVAYDGSI